MSWTKTEHWDAICAIMEDAFGFEETGADEPEFLNWYLVDPDETAIDWFSDRRIDFTGYEEFECPLCGKPNTVDEVHNECHYREKAWSDGEFQYFN